MTHYLDLRLRSLPEISSAAILETAFAKIHQALAAQKRTDIGISFPEVNARRPGLGTCLRMHGKEEALANLLQTCGLETMRDYVNVGKVLPVPETRTFRRVGRVQAKSGLERMRRRLARRHDLSMEEARSRIPDEAAEKLHLPFIRVTSRSTGQAFRLFIQHGPLQAAPQSGEFTVYGLSSTATVPWF